MHRLGAHTEVYVLHVQLKASLTAQSRYTHTSFLLGSIKITLARAAATTVGWLTNILNSTGFLSDGLRVKHVFGGGPALMQPLTVLLGLQQLHQLVSLRQIKLVALEVVVGASSTGVRQSRGLVAAGIALRGLKGCLLRAVAKVLVGCRSCLRRHLAVDALLELDARGSCLALVV